MKQTFGTGVKETAMQDSSFSTAMTMTDRKLCLTAKVLMKCGTD